MSCQSPMVQLDYNKRRIRCIVEQYLLLLWCVQGESEKWVWCMWEEKNSKGLWGKSELADESSWMWEKWVGNEPFREDSSNQRRIWISDLCLLHL